MTCPEKTELVQEGKGLRPVADVVRADRKKAMVPVAAKMVPVAAKDRARGAAPVVTPVKVVDSDPVRAEDLAASPIGQRRIAIVVIRPSPLP